MTQVFDNNIRRILQNIYKDNYNANYEILNDEMEEYINKYIRSFKSYMEKYGKSYNECIDIFNNLNLNDKSILLEQLNCLKFKILSYDRDRERISTINSLFNNDLKGNCQNINEFLNFNFEPDLEELLEIINEINPIEITVPIE